MSANLLVDAFAAAERWAPFCRSLAEVARRVNEELGLDWTDGRWRGLWVRYREYAERVRALLGDPEAAPALPAADKVAVRRVGPPIPEFSPERFFELRLAAEEEWQKSMPKSPELSIALDVGTPIGLVEMSDFHIGAPGTDHYQLRDDLQTIRDHPRVYCGLGGDWGNNMIYGRLIQSGLEEVFAPGDQQLAMALYLYEIPLSNGSAIYVGDGNHNNWTKTLSGLSTRYTLFRDENVKHIYTGDGALITLTVGQQPYRIFRRHRQRYSSVFNPAHAVVAEYQRSPYDFDIGVIEHQHMSHGAEFDGKQREDGSTTRIAIRPGTYKLRDGFAWEHGFHYASHDLQCVLLWPDKRRMHRVRGLHEMIELLDALTG